MTSEADFDGGHQAIFPTVSNRGFGRKLVSRHVSKSADSSVVTTASACGTDASTTFRRFHRSHPTLAKIRFRETVHPPALRLLRWNVTTL